MFPTVSPARRCFPWSAFPTFFGCSQLLRTQSSAHIYRIPWNVSNKKCEIHEKLFCYSQTHRLPSAQQLLLLLLLLLFSPFFSSELLLSRFPTTTNWPFSHFFLITRVPSQSSSVCVCSLLGFSQFPIRDRDGQETFERTGNWRGNEKQTRWKSNEFQLTFSSGEMGN